MKIRSGIGYDIHRLEPGRKLFLGGIEIPFAGGLVGHSDGDCLLHALIDALLGAMGESDIGRIFPDDDPAYKNIRSTELLAQVAEKMHRFNYMVLNIDSIIIAQEPKLAPFTPAMKKLICPLLSIEPAALSIKAKTNEGLGELGRSQAIAAWATVLLQKQPTPEGVVE